MFLDCVCSFSTNFHTHTHTHFDSKIKWSLFDWKKKKTDPKALLTTQSKYLSLLFNFINKKIQFVHVFIFDYHHNFVSFVSIIIFSFRTEISVDTSNWNKIHEIQIVKNAEYSIYWNSSYCFCIWTDIGMLKLKFI